jgi:hypothetical protein
MTPESCIGLLHLADRFGLMLRMLAGQPLPALPAQRGRVVQAAAAPTPEEDAAVRDAEVKAARVWRALADDCEGADCD